MFECFSCANFYQKLVKQTFNDTQLNFWAYISSVCNFTNIFVTIGLTRKIQENVDFCEI